MRTHFALFATVASLLLGTLSSSEAIGKAQGKAGHPHGGKSPEQRAQLFLKRWDKDGDGKLDLTELTAAFRAKQERRQARRAARQGGKSTPAPQPVAPASPAPAASPTPQ